MFFTSGIIIVFFCFSFYLIWNQFLRKESRLTSSLHVLRKKITDLENLSLTVDAQLDRQMPKVNEKIHKLETLLKATQKTCKDLDKKLALYHQEPQKKTTTTFSTTMDANIGSPPKPHLQIKHNLSPKKNTNQFLKATKPAPKKISKFEFGESPFRNIDFSDSPS